MKTKNKIFGIVCSAVLLTLVNSCASIPKNAKAVEKFNVDKYLGTWHEIARFDFRPFYASYNVIALDDNYQYALIAGKNLDYLWILSRSKTIPEEIKSSYLKIAKEIGYDTSKLIWVKHDRNNNPFLNEK